MEQPLRDTESRTPDEHPPLEQELEGLPELDRFKTEADRAAALRAVHRRLENPYTLSYWVWVAILICIAIGMARLIGWCLATAGAPAPFPAALGIVAGVATYVLLLRLVLRWAARPELKRELERRTIPPDSRA